MSILNHNKMQQSANRDYNSRNVPSIYSLRRHIFIGIGIPVINIETVVIPSEVYNGGAVYELFLNGSIQNR